MLEYPCFVGCVHDLSFSMCASAVCVHDSFVHVCDRCVSMFCGCMSVVCVLYVHGLCVRVDDLCG